jgi:hypothetical protein
MPNYKVLNDSEMPLSTEVTDGTQTLNVPNGAAVVLASSLYEIEIGNSYIVSHLFRNVANNSYAAIHLFTGSKATHIEGYVAADGKAIIMLNRSATYSASGTALSIYNLNGNSTNTTVNNALHSPTISTSGTMVYQTLLPAGKGSRVVGAETSSSSETILMPATDYLYRVQNVSSVTGDISIEFTWYEI